MGATVVLGDAEGGHGITSHSSEAVPFPVNMAVTLRLVIRVVEQGFCVPPGLIQTDVGRTRVESWNTERREEIYLLAATQYMPVPNHFIGCFSFLKKRSTYGSMFFIFSILGQRSSDF